MICFALFGIFQIVFFLFGLFVRNGLFGVKTVRAVRQFLKILLFSVLAQKF